MEQLNGQLTVMDDEVPQLLEATSCSYHLQ